jgi:hypothetical protein
VWYSPIIFAVEGDRLRVPSKKMESNEGAEAEHAPVSSRRGMGAERTCGDRTSRLGPARSERHEAAIDKSRGIMLYLWKSIISPNPPY